LHYSVALSNIQIDISSTSLHVLMSWIENFKSILELNLLTQLEYLSQEFWLESSLDKLKTQLDLNDSTQRDQSKYKQVERNSQINIWSHISQVSYYIRWCHNIKKWFYVNVHDTTIKLQCKKMIQSQRDTTRQS